ncbi:MAG: hypothetical protein AB8B51_08975 [Sedimentitalea sp.]
MTFDFPRLLSFAALIAVLSACASPEQAAVNRSELMQKLFPDPNDRAGLHLVFPIDRSALVTHYPNQISDAQAMQKVAGYCQRTFLGSTLVITRESEPGSTVLGDGSTVATRETSISCK